MFIHVSSHGQDPQPVLTTLVSPTPRTDAEVVEMARGAEPLAIREIRRFQLSSYLPALSDDPVIAVNQVRDLYLSCARCHLAESRNYIVFTRGNLYSPVLVVGEGPGREEDKKGVPFVGRSGRLQSEMFREAGLDPDRDVAWANVIGCRPCLDRWSGDRPPTDVEKLACSERFLLLLHAIRPRVVICLGNVATTAFSKDAPPLYRWVGPVATAEAPEDWVIFAHAPHPAGLLRSIAAAHTYARFFAARSFYRALKAQLPTLQKVRKWPFGIQYVQDFLAEGKPLLGRPVSK